MHIADLPSRKRGEEYGESLAITMPAQIAKMYDIEKGNWIEISPIDYGEFKLKEMKK